MAVKPLRGELYLTPTSAAVGGTRIQGIVEDRIEWEDGAGTAHFGGGLEADNWITIRRPNAQPARLTIPLRDVASTTLQLLFAMLSTGTGFDTHGGNGTAIHGLAPTAALVVRPVTSGELFLYGPRWALHAESLARLTWSRKVARYDGSTLILAPQRSLDGTKKAAMFATAANINSHYGL